MDDESRTDDGPTLLAADEPAPFEVLNAGSSTPIVLVCDHASHRFPRSLDDLGLDPAARRSHLAVDIGAGALTRKLASALGATAVLAAYSRLVIDCNRDVLDPEAFLEFSDGVAIPGNHGLTDAQKRSRVQSIFTPYHQAIDDAIARISSAGRPPVLLSIHSFTPVFTGITRPWEVGILWNADARLAGAMLDGLRRAQLVVGDNEPYSGRGPRNFTIDHHGRVAGLPHVAIEVRQDLVSHAAGLDRIASTLHGIIEAMPSPAPPAAGRTIVERNLARANREGTQDHGPTTTQG